MWFKIKILSYLVIWTLSEKFSPLRKIWKTWPSSVRNDHFSELAKEPLDQIWRP